MPAVIIYFTSIFNLGTYRKHINFSLAQMLCMGWAFRGSNRCEGEIFRTRPDRPWCPPNLLYNGYRVFPGGKEAGGGVDHPPHLAPRLKKV